MEGVCVFIVHYYSGLKIGGKHFGIHSQLTVDILDKMMPQKISRQKVPSIGTQTSPGNFLERVNVNLFSITINILRTIKNLGFM